MQTLVVFPESSRRLARRFARRAGALALVALLVLTTGSCAALQQLGDVLKNPEFRLVGVELIGLSLSSLRIRLNTEVKNFYPFDIPSGGVDMGVSLEGAQFVRLKNDFAQGLKSGAATPASFDVELPFQGLAAAFQNIAGKETLRLGLAGDLSVKLPGQRAAIAPGLPERLKLSFQREDTIPAIYPEVEVRNFRLIAPSTTDIAQSAGGALSGAATNYINGLFGGGGARSAASAGLAGLDLEVGTEFEIALKNRGAASLVFDQLNYDLLLDNAPFVKGLATQIRPEGNGSVATIRTSFPIAQVTTALATAIRNKQARFRLRGETGLDTPGSALGGLLRFDIDRSGSLSWR